LGKRGTDLTIGRMWFGGAAILAYSWRLISDRTIWPFVLDAPIQAADLAARMVPPDWSFIAALWRPMWDTINMATLGTAVAVMLAGSLGFFWGRETNPRGAGGPALSLFFLVFFASLHVRCLGRV